MITIYIYFKQFKPKSIELCSNTFWISRMKLVHSIFDKIWVSKNISFDKTFLIVYILRDENIYYDNILL